ncbi:MAG: hypothetical protein WC364_13810 [Eubacteriales bacterium]|jgi:hypothetical protein
MLKWTVEFSVDPSWIADGYDLTDERALEMLAGDLRHAHIETELAAKVISAPKKEIIEGLQNGTIEMLKA